MSAVTHENVLPRARILFVDDSRLMRMCAHKVLGSTYDLVLAESAEEAWRLLEDDERIQVLFTDLQMPGRNGFELLDQVRSSESQRLSELPVILITGAEEREEMRKIALERGASDFITKPFQASELTARVKAHVDSGRSRRKLRILERDHHLDHSSGLGNRRYCEQRLAQAISFAARHGQSLTLMHLRLDGLARLLADLGDPYAGSAQRRIGQTLAGSIRKEDTVFRTGEESFTFLLPATDRTGAGMLQERFLPDLDALGLSGDGHSLEVTCRFHVQPIALDASPDVQSLLDQGLSGNTGQTAAEPDQAFGPNTKPPGIEEALQMIERGESERLRQHLPQLRERLQPLLALLDAR
jgi:two-component system, cell cycle response regulator